MRALATAIGLLASLGATGASAIEYTVRAADGAPLANAMVTRVPAGTPAPDTSDNGYPAPGATHHAPERITRFSDAAGTVRFPPAPGLVDLRARKPGFADTRLVALRADETPELVLRPQPDALALANSRPSNLWLARIDFGGDHHLREHFLLHCAFCHQQGSPFMRADRTAEDWASVFDRMNRYGAQAAHDAREPFARYLHARHAELLRNPGLLPDFEPWSGRLAGVTLREWPLGDSLSQLHDLLLHPNGMVYTGDNLMDRIYEIDPLSGDYRVYRIPHAPDATIGGILGNRFAAGYPKVENYVGVHSFALSPTDGHIFITPSMQQSLLEFDPVSKRFTEWTMDRGFYPHTIRIDARDRVWFTLALSSQVAMFDRRTQQFTWYELPARGWRERALLAIVKWRLGRGAVQTPPKYDHDTSGFPLPYGIDIAPDGTVWVARLNAGDIARIDPASGVVTMIPTPFSGPRRLRCDADGNPWITGFSSGLIARYDARTGRFDTFPLPVQSETPYALNVDRQRHVVWVTGNQSDSLLRFDIATRTWTVYPLVRYRSFTRDIEIDADGSVYTTISNFPAWQIEEAQPMLIRLQDETGRPEAPCASKERCK